MLTIHQPRQRRHKNDMSKSKATNRKSGAAVRSSELVSQRAKRIREDRACEAIICGIMRGFTTKDWKRVFKKVDEIERANDL